MTKTVLYGKHVLSLDLITDNQEALLYAVPSFRWDITMFVKMDKHL